jgi:hypothetical protein
MAREIISNMILSTLFRETEIGKRFTSLLESNRSLKNII